MLNTRVFPTLLYRQNRGLWKGRSFEDHRYVGDVLNAIRIYNHNQVDELCLLDISAGEQGRCISTDLVEKASTECTMPLAAGGGIRNANQAAKIINAGAEKVVLNSILFENLSVITEISDRYGSQAIVASIDAKRSGQNHYDVYSHNGTIRQDVDLVDFARRCEDAGAGELLLTSIDAEGRMDGYDTELIARVTNAVDIPLIANGGGTLGKFRPALDAGASALTAGAAFVFFGPRRAVLINFPDDELVEAELQSHTADNL